MLADMIAEIDARNEVRREAGLPLLSVTAELRPFLLEEGFELVLSLMSFRPRVIGHPMHSSRYRRMVCATCWDRGRATPVTCRTFRAEAARRP